MRADTSAPAFRPLRPNEQQRANSSSCYTRRDAPCQKSIQSCSSVAGQHDQVNVQTLGQGKYGRHDIASQNFSLCHYSFRLAASDSLFQVIRSILL